MKAADIPERFPIPFGEDAGVPTYRRTIPTASQIGTQDGAASLETGFPPLTFTPVAAGGVPPFGADFNGILYRSTAWSRWQNAGGGVPYNAAFSAAVGGYPEGALVATASVDPSDLGLFWFCTTDDNTTDPDAGGAGWIPVWSYPSARIVTASGAFVIGLKDRAIGLNRTTSVAASSAPLPSGAYVGYDVEIADLNSNFNRYPVTITAPAGQTIIGANTKTLNVNGQSTHFRYYGSNLWSWKP